MSSAPTCKFFLIHELTERLPFSTVTMWRMERRGRFPKRVRISPGKVAWRKSDIEAWETDPEGWRAAELERAHG
ncbi:MULTISPECIES: AlpA family phage regulatory protein [unclassified Bradyrhizobium]|uniref:helix-turn-helix transcriptional regulator n=1 Tax=unclassified Bradyrhizobium TaxID=2631580 RepID=UPI002110EC8C|nr:MULTISPECIES: AlpA family phage regulatory protein [unclassified Bradyrhizobium]MCK1533164.1 AlpA family phage regulatory protein [Bradyrhizobium sp. 176]MCK1558265.1 AlpA family phage regulatory protein [Bradyrhizobium sp. 171]